MMVLLRSKPNCFYPYCTETDKYFNQNSPKLMKEDMKITVNIEIIFILFLK